MLVMLHSRKSMKEKTHAPNIVAKNVIGQPAFGFMSANFYHGHVRLITVHFVKVPRCLSVKNFFQINWLTKKSEIFIVVENHIKMSHFTILRVWDILWFSCLLFCWSAIEIVINEVIRKIEMDALMNLTSIAIEFNGVIHAIGLPHTSLNDTTYAIVGCSGILILKGKKKIVIFIEHTHWVKIPFLF